MTAQRRLVFIAPLLLALAFVGHLLNVLVFEPGLGFSSAEDFYDASKFLPVIDHPVWQLGALYHLLVGAALLLLTLGALKQKDCAPMPYVKAVGISGAVMFAIVCIANLVGMRELGVIADLHREDAEALYGAYLIFRAVLLNAAVLLLGAFLFLANSARLIPGSENAAVRYLGMAAGMVGVLVPLLPPITPVLVLSTIAWGLSSAILGFRGREQST